MVCPLRIEYPGAYYHVINRGNNQEKISKNKAREVREDRLLISKIH